MKNLDTVYAERIASEYDQKPASKLVALKKLDRKALYQMYEERNSCPLRFSPTPLA